MTVWKQTREGSLMYVESDLPYKETNVNWPSSSEYLRFQCSIRISGVPDQSVLTVYNKVVECQSQDLYDWVRSYFTTVTCKRGFPLNPLLVILNAESKFRRHLREVPAPPTLPGDVMELMSKTLQLLELIYWDPIARLGTPEMIGFPMVVDDAAMVPQSAPTDMAGNKRWRQRRRPDTSARVRYCYWAQRSQWRRMRIK